MISRTRMARRTLGECAGDLPAFRRSRLLQIFEIAETWWRGVSSKTPDLAGAQSAWSQTSIDVRRLELFCNLDSEPTFRRRKVACQQCGFGRRV